MTTESTDRIVYAASPVVERRPVGRRDPELAREHGNRHGHSRHGRATPPVEPPDVEQPAVHARPINGAAAAAVLAAGIGAAFFGVLVTVAEAFRPLAKVLAFSSAVGPLSGKTTVAMVVWLAIWAAVHWLWRERDVPFRSVTTATIVLLIVALLGTFPPVYEAIAALAGH